MVDCDDDAFLRISMSTRFLNYDKVSLLQLNQRPVSSTTGRVLVSPNATKARFYDCDDDRRVLDHVPRRVSLIATTSSFFSDTGGTDEMPYKFLSRLYLSSVAIRPDITLTTVGRLNRGVPILVSCCRGRLSRYSFRGWFTRTSSATLLRAGVRTGPYLARLFRGVLFLRPALAPRERER